MAEMLVSVSVVDNNRCITPWSVVSVDSDHTFIDLYGSIKAGKYSIIKSPGQLTGTTVDVVSVGKDKGSMSIVGCGMNVCDVCRTFGSFVKFKATQQQNCEKPAPVMDAFSVMMASQRILCAPALPERLQERTKKDKLYNDLILLVDTMGLKWPGSELNSGRSFLSTLTNVLWYVDGHHESLAERGCSVPEIFKSFTGYNIPELSKHRKRQIGNLSSDALAVHVSSLYDSLLLSWINTKKWEKLKSPTLLIAKSLDKYLAYLKEQSKRVSLHHIASNRPVSDSMTIAVLPPNTCLSQQLMKLNDEIGNKQPYELVHVGEFAPSDRKKRYTYIQNLQGGLSKCCALCTYSLGGPLGNYHFVWRLPEMVTLDNSLQENQKIIEQIKENAPKYHNRALRRHLIAQFGRISQSTNLALLREFYRQATGDQSASLTTAEKEMDERLREALEMEDPEVIVDLRENNGRQSDKFKVFWECMATYLRDATAVHERRHGNVTYMAKAISVRDLIQEVSKLCPGEPVPSEQWARLQFFPRNPRAKTANQYKSRFEVKMMVQKRQFRHDHPDAHYCAAIFRYMREYAVTQRDQSLFVSLDDKHRIKVGEPGQPVAAVERGKRVLVGRNETFEVSDHDFCKFSLVPSVSFVIDIPETFEESWYRGTVNIGYKDAVFEPSSALHHVAELYSIVQKESKPILFVYTDGGPDHRLTFLSVQLSLIALFRNLNLDLLVAARTVPMHSWKNPVERIMSIVNLGLQCIGMMRGQGTPEFEAAIKNANNLSQLRGAASSQYKEEVKSSLQQPIDLLKSVTPRLELKGKPFSVFDSASDDEISDFWESLHFIDPSIETSDSSKEVLSSRPKLKAFMEHCCQERHYTFCIKKCGNSECNICRPIRMDPEKFATLRYLPDSILGSDGHYLAFEEVFKFPSTSEKDRPSLQAKNAKKSLTYSPVKSHALNVGVVIQCDECSKWRLLFSKRKISFNERCELEQIISEVSYTCGARISDLELPNLLKCVEVRIHKCTDRIEKLYYSAYPQDTLCIHCGSTENVISDIDGVYPYCFVCTTKERVYKRGALRSTD